MHLPSQNTKELSIRKDTHTRNGPDVHDQDTHMDDNTACVPVGQHVREAHVTVWLCSSD